jgi:hypothetical protein
MSRSCASAHDSSEDRLGRNGSGHIEVHIDEEGSPPSKACSESHTVHSAVRRLFQILQTRRPTLAERFAA